MCYDDFKYRDRLRRTRSDKVSDKSLSPIEAFKKEYPDMIHHQLSFDELNKMSSPEYTMSSKLSNTQGAIENTFYTNNYNGYRNITIKKYCYAILKEKYSIIDSYKDIKKGVKLWSYDEFPFGGIPLRTFTAHGSLSDDFWLIVYPQIISNNEIDVFSFDENDLKGTVSIHSVHTLVTYDKLNAFFNDIYHFCKINSLI